ncbi:MAG TPA: hypothetical protein VLX28_19675 [Thermoanaerobaculia bacterium]|nr:hypothetical protein [Thermoanaerobaculia bacterium]
MAFVLACAFPLLTGCGGSEETAPRTTSAASQGERFGPPVGHGTGMLNCQTFAFIGMGPDDWRRSSASFGPLGMLVTDYAKGRRSGDGLFHTKIPTLVEGHRSVVLSVPRDERARAGIEVVKPHHPLSRLRLDPCRDRKRTIWAAGVVARDRGPVTLDVSVAGGRSGTITVGDGG